MDRSSKALVDDIVELQKKRHTDQISLIIELAALKRNRTLIELLQNLQHLLWCIDDTVDNSLSDDLIYKNEVAKFVLFHEISKLIVKYQLSRKADILNLILGRCIVAERLLECIERNIESIVKIPEIERKMTSKLRGARDIDTAVDAAMSCLLCRAAVMDLYADIINTLENIELPKNHLKLMRAVQLLREDFEDAEEDIRNGSVNVVVELREIGLVEEVVFRILRKVEKELESADGRIKGRLTYEKSKIMGYLRSA